MAKLSNQDLVARMDSVLQAARAERMYPYYNEKFDFDPYVGQFFRTASFKQLQENKQRPAIWKTFDLIVQMEYVRSYGGFQNSIPQPQRHGDTWESPRYLIPFLAVEQASIVGARIVLERFMDLVFFLVTGNELKGSSTFLAFKDWLFDLPIDSPWFYLLPQLPWLRQHDISFRSAEVHDGSKLKKYLVTMQQIPSDLMNEAMDLTNLLGNLWRNILPILDGQKASSIGGFRPEYNVDWMTSYHNSAISELEVLKKSVAIELKKLG